MRYGVKMKPKNKFAVHPSNPKARLFRFCMRHLKPSKSKFRRSRKLRDTRWIRVKFLSLRGAGQ